MASNYDASHPVIYIYATLLLGQGMPTQLADVLNTGSHKCISYVVRWFPLTRNSFKTRDVLIHCSSALIQYPLWTSGYTVLYYLR